MPALPALTDEQRSAAMEKASSDLEAGAALRVSGTKEGVEHGGRRKRTIRYGAEGRLDVSGHEREAFYKSGGHGGLSSQREART